MSLKSFTAETQSILDELNIIVFETDTSSFDDYTKAITSLWVIVSDNLTQINENVEKVHSIYSIAASVRLILECLADAKYLSGHREESSSYITNQDRISEELNSRGTENYMSAFIDGTVNRFGQLRERRTVDRITNYLSDAHMGDYNMLCFYCHPNVASLTWLNALGQNALVGYFLLNLSTYLDDILKVLPNPEPNRVDFRYVATLILQAASNHLPSDPHQAS